MVKYPEQWAWSSYLAMVGQAPTPVWLSTESLLSQYGRKRKQVRQRYRDFVLAGIGQTEPWVGLRQQVYLFDMQDEMQVLGDELSIPKQQRRAPAPTLAEIADANPE